MSLEIFRWGMFHLFWSWFSYTLTKDECYCILQRHANPSRIKPCGGGLIFQRDNDLKHTLKLSQAFLKSKQEQGVLTCMTSLPQSSDASPNWTSVGTFENEKAKDGAKSQDTVWILEFCNRLKNQCPAVRAAIKESNGKHQILKMLNF